MHRRWLVVVVGTCSCAVTGDLGESGSEGMTPSASAPTSELDDGEDSESTTGEIWVDEEEATSDPTSDTADSIGDPPPCDSTQPIVALRDESASDLGQDATHVYFADRVNGELGRISKATDELELLVTDQNGPSELALDETHLYWFDSDDSAIRRVTKTGIAIELVGEVATEHTVLAIAGEWIYFTIDDAGGGLARTSKDGSVQEIVDPYDYEYAAPLATDGVHAYYVADGELRRHDAALEAGTGIELIAEVHGAESLEIGDTLVFIASDYDVYAIPKTGGPVTQLSQAWLDLPMLAVQGDIAYWGNQNLDHHNGCGGGVLRGGLALPEEVLVSMSSEVFPTALVVDGERIWFSDRGLNRIDF